MNQQPLVTNKGESELIILAFFSLRLYLLCISLHFTAHKLISQVIICILSTFIYLLAGRTSGSYLLRTSVVPRSGFVPVSAILVHWNIETLKLLKRESIHNV